ncbi:SDR family NAD(P)-dependent oxidoreductase [Nocardia panacis]|uniref:SDR family NAD(P)-dependent oxidoreductase n=1 Tax=Nocardia panacis TaxID=2340916 RepID=A0A3A4KI56_9NOCA|nr:SDR family NAD(P)-dependent oxidoreductase [Nocardia panacis]
MRDIDRVFLLTAGPRLAEYDMCVARAAAGARVRHVVKLSSGRAGDDTATDPIPTWHRAGEAAVRATGVPWTMLRPLGFMSNALHWAGTIIAADTVYAPYPQGRVAAIDPADIAAVAAAVLTGDGHTGQVYTLAGPQALSPAEQTSILGEILDRPLRLVEISPERALADLIEYGVPPEMAEAILALRASALKQFTSIIHPTVQEITGCAPRTFAQWATAHATQFRPGAA